MAPPVLRRLLPLLAVQALVMATGPEGLTQGQADMLAKVAAALSEHAASTRGRTVSLEVYFGTTCPHCLDFLKNALYPLVHAGIPQGAVRLTLLPWVKGDQTAETCLSNLPCSYARAVMCALNATLPQPVDLASDAVKRSLDFVCCDLHNTVQGATPPQNVQAISSCARQSHIAHDGPTGLRSCIDSGLGNTLLTQDAFRQKIRVTEQTLAQYPEQLAPFVFLDGELLVCSSAERCIGTRSPSGPKPFAAPGSLLRVICSRLSPTPTACHSVLKDRSAGPPAGASPRLHEVTKACENCVEDGAFKWHWGHAERKHVGQEKVLWVGHALAALGLLTLLAGGALVAWRHLSPSARAAPVGEVLLAPAEEGGLPHGLE